MPNSSDPPPSLHPDPSTCPPQPLATSSDGHDLLPNFSFHVMKPRSKRKPSLKLSKSVTEQRPWNLRSIGIVRRHRPLFSLPLSSEEIEEDIYAVTGSRAKRRPKKRPRHVQKQIDMVFPGMWLTEVSVELYRVPEER